MNMSSCASRWLALLMVGGMLCPAGAKARWLVGKISEYGCGDNCYLTIVDAKGKSHDALCTAKLCQPWNEAVEMPKEFYGRKVKVKVGTGIQYDGGDNIMGKMDAFEEIELLP